MSWTRPTVSRRAGKAGCASAASRRPTRRNAVSSATAEEGEARSLWDIINGVTASARAIVHTDDRVALEREAGKLMRFVADK